MLSLSTPPPPPYPGLPFAALSVFSFTYSSYGGFQATANIVLPGSPKRDIAQVVSLMQV